MPILIPEKRQSSNAPRLTSFRPGLIRFLSLFERLTGVGDLLGRAVELLMGSGFSRLVREPRVFFRSADYLMGVFPRRGGRRRLR